MFKIIRSSTLQSLENRVTHLENALGKTRGYTYELSDRLRHTQVQLAAAEERHAALLAHLKVQEVTYPQRTALECI